VAFLACGTVWLTVILLLPDIFGKEKGATQRHFLLPLILGNCLLPSAVAVLSLAIMAFGFIRGIKRQHF
jgi:hypothetical protein